jgi:galactose mutarotase-like enzyme
MAVFEIQNNLFSVKINSFGAELCSVLSKNSSIEYIWQGDKSVWARHAPNLFPIVGKLKDGQFKYQSQSYQLPQHGFARDNEFTCIEQTADHLLFELVDSNETLIHYPFHFRFLISYKLEDNILKTGYSVSNADSKDLYFSVGAHPAFNCPLETWETFADYKLIFPWKDKLSVHTLNEGLITSHTKNVELQDHQLHISKELFDHDALVFMNSQIDEVKLVSSKTDHGVSLTSKDWPYFGIWTKKGTTQFVCLEPWYGIADHENANGDLEEKTGIIKLVSGQHFECSFDMIFF